MDWTIGPLDPWTTISWTIFLGPSFFFGPFYRGGGHTISTQGAVGCSLSVLREE